MKGGRRRVQSYGGKQGKRHEQVYEYRKMIKDETHNDILAQISPDFMQNLIVKRAQEIKREVFEE